MLVNIPDVSFEALRKGGAIPHDPSDGYLGNFTDGEFRLRVRLALGSDQYQVFTTDGARNVTPKRPRMPGGLAAGVYQRVIQTHRSHTGTYYAVYPGNHLSLLDANSDDGTYRIYQVAVVSRGKSEFFLTAQLAHQGRCYRAGRAVVAPRLVRWPHVAVYVGERMMPKLSCLSPIQDFNPPSLPDGKDLPPKTGQVLWWREAEGLGAIITPEGSARLWWYYAKRLPRRPYFSKGELVRYRKLREIVGQDAKHTTFKKEALGVAPASS